MAGLNNISVPPADANVIAARRRRVLAGYPDLAEKYLKIKQSAVTAMDALVEKAVQNLKAKGCKVYLAADAAGAREIILNLVSAPMAVKSRSLALEEAGVAAALRSRGVDVVETALGDFIMQLAGSKAAHPVLPSWRLSEGEVLAALRSRLREAVDLGYALKEIRNLLRQYICSSAYGITGVSAVVAETGSLIIMEDEGNARAVSNLPHTHIAVAGIDKIVPDHESALTVCRTAAMYGVGREVGNYLSVISGPSSTADIQGHLVLGMHGPKELVVILLDNGRRRCVQEGFEQLLYCCNCGACLEVCPVFMEKGPEYGGRYPGGRGAAFTSFTEGLSQAREAGLDWCQGCGSCRQACPANIDTPVMIRRLLKAE